MARRVQVDPYVLLGLVAGQHRPGLERMLASCGQVLDGNVQVHGHLLVARPGAAAWRVVSSSEGTAMRMGYKLATEAFGPDELIRQAVLAEEAASTSGGDQRSFSSVAR